jgi:GTP pyrophosphokinase/guanosine-3',5'-bis(diphosphate) 3'-pyrophosphohydrolase
MSGGDGVAATTPASPPAAGAGAPPRKSYLRQFELVERVRGYDPSVDENLINRAYVYATAKHGGQKRHSGDPYFAHPIQVAGILTEYKLDRHYRSGAPARHVEDTDATGKRSKSSSAQVADLVKA